MKYLETKYLEKKYSENPLHLPERHLPRGEDRYRTLQENGSRWAHRLVLTHGEDGSSYHKKVQGEGAQISPPYGEVARGVGGGFISARLSLKRSKF